MTDHDALLAAVSAHPDDDTPRLIFADWLEEHNRPERAAFVRAQVELARTPAWEPFAVLCRRRRPDWGTGREWRSTLPDVTPWGCEWHPDRPFRRGFGWAVRVRSVAALAAHGNRLFDAAPVGELHLPAAATLAEWEAVAAADWLPRVKVLHFDASPVEPLRVLRDSPHATGIEDIHFRRCGAGIAAVVEDLLASPLGRQVGGLHFSNGHGVPDDLFDSLGGGANVERLSFGLMGLTGDHVERLLEMPFAARLTALDLRHNPVGWEGATLLTGGRLPALQSLRVRDADIGTGDPPRDAPRLGGMRHLDLSGNPLPWWALGWLMQPRSGLRSVELRAARVSAAGLRGLVRSAAWRNLVELDLRHNPELTDRGARHLTAVPPPPDLTALMLDGYRLLPNTRAALRDQFGDRVLLDGEPRGGLV